MALWFKHLKSLPLVRSPLDLHEVTFHYWISDVLYILLLLLNYCFYSSLLSNSRGNVALEVCFLKVVVYVNHYLSQKVSSRRRIARRTSGDSAVWNNVKTETSSVDGETHFGTTVNKKKKKDLPDNNWQKSCRQCREAQHCTLFYGFSCFVFVRSNLFVIGAILVHCVTKNWRDDLELGSSSQSFNVCVLEQNKMLQLHLSCFCFLRTKYKNVR